MDVSIVIPIYNASDIVENTLKQLVLTLDPLNIDYEILLQDDGSIDSTREVLKRIDSKYSQVKCFYGASNSGLGTTLRHLFDEAKGDNIIYCDCDLPFGAEIISVLLDKLQNADIAVASRYSGISNHVQLLRRIFSRVYFLLCKLLFNIPVIDVGSGSVAINRLALNTLDLKRRGFGIHAEIYVKAYHRGLLIVEFPAKSKQNQQRSFSIWKHGSGIILETFQLWVELLKNLHCIHKVKSEV